MAVLFNTEKRASAAFMVLFVGSFIPNAFTLYFQPAVNFFNPFLGYYPGPIYDELIEVSRAYLTFRVWCLVMVAAIWGAVRLFRSRCGQARITRSIPGWIIVIGLWVAAGLMVHSDGRFSFRTTRSAIEEELSFVRSTDLCTIHADKSWIKRGNLLDLLVNDCDFRYRQTAKFFGTGTTTPVQVYLYADAEQKARLMGARWVEISKPWLNEIHVTDMMPGDMIFAHEIAHVTAGRRNGSFLAMPLTMGVIPNMGMVEGLAVAASFADDGPSPHEWALAMIHAGIEPDLEGLFSPGSFVSGGAASSYTVAGSFLRFIFEKYGANAVGRLAEGRSFEKATGRTLEVLKKEWLAFLGLEKGRNVDKVLEMRAASRFSDPGVLYRRCPLDIARRLRDAMLDLEQGHLDDALDLVRQAVDFDRDDRDLKRLAARMEFTVARGIGNADRFQRIIEDVMRPPNGAASMGDRTAAADLMILRGLNDIDEARATVFLDRAASELRDLHAMLTPGAALRGVCARLMVFDVPRSAGMAIIEALSDPRPWNEGDTDALMRAAQQNRNVAILHYLAGRAAMKDGLFDMAQASFLAGISAGFTEPDPLPRNPDGSFSIPPCAPDFEFESWKLLAISAFWAGDLPTSGIALTRARRTATFEGDRLLIDEYLGRIARP
jgi:hypothetical protein